MTIKSKVRFAWAYLTKQRAVQVTDKATQVERTFTLDDLPDDIQLQLQLYGIGKVLQDRNSQEAADDKIAGFDKVWDQLTDGTWKSERKGGGLGIVAPVIEVVAAKRGYRGTAGTAKAQREWKATSKETQAKLLELWKDDIQKVKDARQKDDEVMPLDDLLK